ncbi:MAG: HAD-IA family hydrolase [bacterium]|nr:HAD-IA family hydrolase [bacterium]
MKGVDNFENIGEFTSSAPNFLVDIYGVLLIPKREVADTAEIFQNPLEINHHLLEFLKQKRHNGSKIAIISNVAQYQFEKEFWSRLTDLEQGIFDQIILSGNEGVSKPNPKIFQIALERLSEIPENCVLVDDSPTNVEVARRLGMGGIIYQNFNQFEQEMEELCQNCQR